METFDVDLAGFLPTDAGIAYANIRDKVLPYLQKLAEECRASYEFHGGVVKELDAFRVKLSGLRDSLIELTRKCEGEICGRSFREILMFDAGPVAKEIDPNAACAAFNGWANGVDDGTGDLLKAVSRSCENETEGVKCMEEFLSVFRGAIEFWEAAKDVYVCDYVFAQAAMKYKMKICRDIIRLMPTVIQKGEVFLAQCDANKFDFGKNEEYILERADEAVEAAENRLDVYRKAKAVAERSGIGAAFEEWKRCYEAAKRQFR